LAVVPGGGDRLHIRKSRMSRWRAAVLISVNALMALHIVLWYNFGHPRKTLSPVEPSESMYTIELGQLNAGFVFFAAALLSTFLFGRFFCGWGCHMVALQDLCTHWMNKLGVRPKPFRSRMLLWGPLLLALYMFTWVPFKRAALAPLFAAMQWTPPSWLLTLPGPRPPFENHFIVTEYWRTFPPWFVAIPFLIICGFAAVYFLGSKGFCTYACPYGGFFAPMDKISVGRIVVNDSCEGCGHCTAVCTSNVRVHQEVRDFGMVVDPGCMKCMDCVSVCPNHALSFSFAAPAVLAKPRTPEAKAGHIQRPEYDLSRGWDTLLFALAIGLFIAYRGMPFISYRGELGLVPLLMAAGMAAIGAFFAWRVLTLLVSPNARLQSLQLRRKGALRPAGAMFIFAAIAFLGVGAWGGAVQACSFIGSIYDEQVRPDQRVVFSDGYQPTEADRANALKAIRWIERAGPISRGGIGWAYNVDALNRRAWLYAAAGDLEKAEQCLTEAVDLSKKPNVSAVFDLSRIMLLRKKPIPEIDAMYERVLAKSPDQHQIRVVLAGDLIQMGQAERGLRLVDEIGAATPMADPVSLAQAGEILLGLERYDQALPLLERASRAYDDNGLLHAEYGRALWFKDRPAEGEAQMRRAIELEPDNPLYLHVLAEMLARTGRTGEADQAERRALEIETARRSRR
jgi:tetratricopeptide (TPR) repeat protein/ferredoxin